LVLRRASTGPSSRYRPTMPDHDAEIDAMMEQLVTAGLIEVFTDDGGDQAMRLTPEGERVARQLAMSDDDDQDALLGEGSA
jgi:hypothetical protein